VILLHPKIGRLFGETKPVTFEGKSFV